jgi:hypothetical protein
MHYAPFELAGCFNGNTASCIEEDKSGQWPKTDYCPLNMDP